MAEITVFYEGPIVTLAEARVAGLKRHFTGKPCKYGHVAERLVSPSSCCICVKKRDRERPNRLARLASQRARRAINGDAIRAVARARRAANLEAARASQRKWYAANREKILSARKLQDSECGEPAAVEITVLYDGAVIAREMAREAGLKHYFTGRPCKNGHVAQRYVASGDCKRCAVAATMRSNALHRERCLRNHKAYWSRSAARRQSPEHKERRNAAARRRRALNAEKFNRMQRERYSSNREREIQRARRWAIENPEKARVIWAKRMARKKGSAVGSVTAEDIDSLFEKQKGRCAICNRKIKRVNFILTI